MMILQTKRCRSDVRRLLASLQDILALESTRDWTNPAALSPFGMKRDFDVCRNTSRSQRTEQSRDDVAAWLLEINHELRLNPETFVLSVYILDRFLIVVKAHPKYLHCIGVSCLFLAMKCVEEDEAIPSTHDLVHMTGCSCSVAEILRMERVILNKLDWDLQPLKSPLDVLHVLHAILLLKQTTWFSSHADGDGCRIANRQLSSLTRKLFTCLLRREVVLDFRPSTLALALVSLELGLCTENWLAATVALQRLTGVDETDLIRCREVVSRILADNQATRRDRHSRRHRRPPPPPPSPMKTHTYVIPRYHNQQKHHHHHHHHHHRHHFSETSNPVIWEDCDRDDDDIHDAIKRLYGDILSP